MQCGSTSSFPGGLGRGRPNCVVSGGVPGGQGWKLWRGGGRLYSFKKLSPSHRDEHFQSMCVIKEVECGCGDGMLHCIVVHLDRGTERRKDTRLKARRPSISELCWKRMLTMSARPDKRVELPVVARDKHFLQLLGTCEPSSPSQSGVGGDAQGW